VGLKSYEWRFPSDISAFYLFHVSGLLDHLALDPSPREGYHNSGEAAVEGARDLQLRLPRGQVVAVLDWDGHGGVIPAI